MSVHSLVALAAAYALSIAFPLVILPWILDRRGDLPYNSVASRILAWSSFAALLVGVSTLGADGLSWSPATWAIVLGAILFAALWDLRDLKVRRIPQGRHPNR